MNTRWVQGLCRKIPKNHVYTLITQITHFSIKPYEVSFILYLYVSLSLKQLLQILGQMNSLPRHINVAWCSPSDLLKFPPPVSDSLTVLVWSSISCWHQLAEFRAKVSRVRPAKQHWENKKDRHVRGLLTCTQSQRREWIKCPTAERTQNCYMISSALMQASVTQSLSLLLLFESTLLMSFRPCCNKGSGSEPDPKQA